MNRQGMLKILSAADGCADDTIQEAQVPWVSGREIDEILLNTAVVILVQKCTSQRPDLSVKPLERLAMCRQA